MSRENTYKLINGEWIPLSALDQAFAEYGDIPANIGMRGGKSRALGCMPSEVKEKNMELARLGLDAKYDKKGDLHYANRQTRNRLFDLTGTYDRDAGYGDRAG